MSLVVLDTDVASALLRRRIPEPTGRQLAGHTLAVTFVTIGELTKWTLVRRWGPRRVASVHTFLAGLIVLPYDQHVAARWGDCRPSPNSAAGPGPSTIRGSPRAAWSASCRSRRSTPRTSPTSPSTRDCSSCPPGSQTSGRAGSGPAAARGTDRGTKRRWPSLMPPGSDEFVVTWRSYPAARGALWSPAGCWLGLAGHTGLVGHAVGEASRV